jgi:hypothetical protein
MEDVMRERLHNVGFKAAAFLMALSLFSSARAQAAQAEAPADGLWSRVAPESLGPGAASRVKPGKSRTLRLDQAVLEGLLNRAPLERSEAAKAEAVEMDLPWPDGSSRRFRIEESPIMEPELAARFPEIRTYRGQGVDDPSLQMRFDWSPAGFHALASSAEGLVYVDPYAEGDSENYVVFNRRDHARTDGEHLQCESKGSAEAADAGLRPALEEAATADLLPAIQPPHGSTLRTYRLAVAAAGEYTQRTGGTVSSALSAIVTTINRVNLIYIREISVAFILVANNDRIIFTIPATDPYVTKSFEENQVTIDAVIGRSNYDIGHLFFQATAAAQSNADLQTVCNSATKAHGRSGSSTFVGDPFAIDHVAHVLGHQFGARHTNEGGAACGRGSLPYERLSGSTIMARAGLCGAQNLQAHPDPYFHSASLEELIAFLNSPADSCASTSPATNNPPVVSAGPDYTIPRGTPFTLRATGSDPNLDPLKFSWEEMDIGSSTSLCDDGDRSLFRSFLPTTSPERTFPRLASILANVSCSLWEAMPTTGRDMRFRVIARDEWREGGGTSADEMVLHVRGDAGPFLVTLPNAASTRWIAGSIATVTWQVANTNVAPIGVANVRISLSTDGGLSFPIVLEASTPNDGTEIVNVPAVATTQARVKVEALGNVFFDLSNANFTIARGVYVSDASVTEGNSGTTNATFTVRLVPAVASGSVNVVYRTLNGSAIAPGDYTAVPPTALSFSAGMSTRSVNVSVRGDLVGEPDERLYLNLLSATGGAAIADALGEGTIRNDDPAGFSITNASATEGNSGSKLLVFGISLSAPFPVETRVNYATASGSALAGSDYEARTGTLVFTPGQTTKLVTVRVFGDRAVEPSESFFVNLSGAVGTGIIDSQGVGTILNDD